MVRIALGGPDLLPCADLEHPQAAAPVGYDDVPPEDMRPILMPWAEQTSSVFYFEGDQVYGGEPLDAD